MEKKIIDSDDNIFMTKESIDNLKEKLSNLVNVERPKILEELAEARKQGDLSENADYDAAREKQAELEGEIQNIESILLKVKEIDKVDTNVVEISNIVEYLDLSTNQTKKVKLVSNNIEVDPFSEILSISVNSPIGKAIINKKRGEKIILKLPNGEKEIEIKQIS